MSTSSSSPSIVVVGAGCGGLAVAVQLLQAGHTGVTIVARDTTPRTTSDEAGALWRPFGEVSDANRTTFTRWGKETFDFLNDLRLKHGSDATGIALVSGFEVFSSAQPTPFWVNEVINFRMLDAAALHALGLPQHKHGFAYTSLIVEMGIYLQWLHREFFRLGGKLDIAELRSLSEVQTLYPSARLIVNCAGLGAGQLVGDSSVFPVAGHIVKVRAPGLHHFFMDSENTTYIFPRTHDCIVGGTYFKHDANTRPSIQTRDDILARAGALAPEIKKATFVGEYVGLRPYRDVTRLELELPAGHPQAAAQKLMSKALAADVRLPVIHNYGHGGSGVTLHWGCGISVLELVNKVLPTPNKSIVSKL